jgi:hypothetical protein
MATPGNLTAGHEARRGVPFAVADPRVRHDGVYYEPDPEIEQARPCCTLVFEDGRFTHERSCAMRHARLA